MKKKMKRTKKRRYKIISLQVIACSTGVTVWLFSARKCRLLRSAFIFYPIFVKLAGNQDRQNLGWVWILTLLDHCLWSYMPLSIKFFSYRLIRENGFSMLVHSILIGSLSNLLVTRIGIKSRTVNVWMDQTSLFGVMCPWWGMEKHFSLYFQWNF